MSDDTISLITYLPEDKNAAALSKGLLGEAIAGNSDPSTGQEKSIGRVEVPIEAMEAQMTNLLKNVGKLLSRVKQSAGDVAGMELQEVELSVSINAAGEVSLLGIGGTQAGVEGAITLKFGKPD
ncbi:hypothetical protein Lepto7376_3221 [[Leptolyngbya] sp. PCC 7376]|uniref:Pepco domain-containing protein n=1 Tax=[Leptolyngbya] sp. PCC 7376 TaxID=111781 RepID=UPI00029F4A28|nr:hypothetical protein [[Leptolyngbya] sp. PCC 7376]AFY39449.1 hypothetical protein Lepto7376_3221 [[Leptolyngbya] sp. PCC 7376]